MRTARKALAAVVTAAATVATRVGAAVAKRLLLVLAADGSAAASPPFVAGTQPGAYRPTPPKFPAPVFTNWGSVTPFVLRSGRQFRPTLPPPVTSAAYAKALNQVKSLGQDCSADALDFPDADRGCEGHHRGRPEQGGVAS